MHSNFNSIKRVNSPFLCFLTCSILGEASYPVPTAAQASNPSYVVDLTRKASSVKTAYAYVADFRTAYSVRAVNLSFEYNTGCN